MDKHLFFLLAGRSSHPSRSMERDFDEFLAFQEFRKQRDSYRPRSRHRSNSSSRRSERSSRRSWSSRRHGRTPSRRSNSRYSRRSRTRSRSSFSPRYTPSPRSSEYSSGSPSYTEHSISNRGDKRDVPASPTHTPVVPASTPITSEEAPSAAIPQAFQEAMGTRAQPPPATSASLHTVVALDWNEKLKAGFTKEWRVAARVEFPPPENCLRLRPPKINVEVESAIPASCKERDSRIMERQGGVSAGLVGVGAVLSSMLSSGDEKYTDWISTLSKSSNFLLDAYLEDINIRRSLALGNLNVSLKDALKNTEWNEFLFGDKLKEEITVAKQISQSAAELKATKATASKNVKNPPRSQPFYKGQQLGGHRSYNQKQNHQRQQHQASRQTTTQPSRRRSTSRNRRQPENKKCSYYRR